MGVPLVSIKDKVVVLRTARTWGALPRRNCEWSSPPVTSRRQCARFSMPTRREYARSLVQLRLHFVVRWFALAHRLCCLGRCTLCHRCLNCKGVRQARPRCVIDQYTTTGNAADYTPPMAFADLPIRFKIGQACIVTGGEGFRRKQHSNVSQQTFLVGFYSPHIITARSDDLDAERTLGKSKKEEIFLRSNDARG